MFSGDDVLAAEEDLFMQFFAWADAGKSQLHVDADLESRQANEIGCQIYAPPRAPQVENDPFTAATECAGLKHQLNSFRNGHEVPTHLRMRDSHRSPRTYLSKKSRHDASTTAEDVAESDRYKI